MDAEKLPSNPGRTLAVQEPPVKFRFGPEFKKKWGFIPNLDGIDKMFRNQRRLGNSPDADYHHMLVFGPPGCGKTTFVNELMAVYERDPSKINCIVYNTLGKIVQKIATILKDEIKWIRNNNAKVSTIENLIQMLHISDKKLEEEFDSFNNDLDSFGIPIGNANTQNALPRYIVPGAYFVLDNVHYIKREQNDKEIESDIAFNEVMEDIFYKLEYFAKKSKHNICFTFISQQPLSLPIPTLCIPYPSGPFLSNYVWQALMAHTKHPKIEPKLVALIEDPIKREKNLAGLCRQISNTYLDDVKEFKLVKEITEKCLEHCVLCEKPRGSIPDNYFYNMASELDKVLRNNHRLAYKPITEIRAKMEEVEDRVDAVKSDMATRSKKTKIILTTEDQKFVKMDTSASVNKLPNIPTILLIACYIANVVPENRDAYLVANKRTLRGEGKANMTQDGQSIDLYQGKQYKKAASKERIEFWTQCLLAWVYTKDLACLTREVKSFHHTLDFFTNYKLLESFRLIKRKKASPIDEFSDVKFECQVERDKIEEMASNFGLHIIDFIGSKKSG